ncbi:hypothetical protein [Phosphitispora sp. TUW77]|uniref:hypothetical protein n=1 Tax=Phosphitispora sp. TUW77 TaxID=3152361 RepID=UPI003AB3D738
MQNIFKEFIRLNQSLALLPLKAVRKLLDDKNTSGKQMVDVAEEFVSTPFVAADKLIGKGCHCCSVQEDPSGQQRSVRKGRGPSAANIFVDPEVTVLSDAETNPEERKAVLSVTGLLCGG